MGKKARLLRQALAGAVSGLFNGLFGGGGGVVAVLALRGLLSDEVRAHATATMTMFALSGLSFFLYALSGQIAWREGLMLLPGGLVGALIGARALKRIGGAPLKRIFGGLLAASGLFMLLR